MPTFLSTPPGMSRAPGFLQGKSAAHKNHFQVDLNGQLVPQAMSWQSCLPSTHRQLSSCPGTRAGMAAFPSYCASLRDLPSYPGITDSICHHGICLCNTRQGVAPSLGMFSAQKKVCSVHLCSCYSFEGHFHVLNTIQLFSNAGCFKPLALSLRANLTHQSTCFLSNCKAVELPLQMLLSCLSAGPVPYCFVLFQCCWQQHHIKYWPFHHQSIQLYSKKLILFWEDSASQCCLGCFFPYR